MHVCMHAHVHARVHVRACTAPGRSKLMLRTLFTLPALELVLVLLLLVMLRALS